MSVDVKGKTSSFLEHLSELRRRIVYCVATLVVGFIVAWILKEELFAIVSAPVREGLAQHGIYRLTAIETVEAIMVYLKLAVAAAIVVATPMFLYQVWAFVKPGLMPNEQQPMRRIAVLAVFMFALGLLFAYRIVLPLVIDFLTGFTLGAGGVDFQVTMKSAYSTTLLFLVGFGVIFELPLVMVLLAATPLFSSAKYFRWIRYSVVLSFVIGSMLTPPDVISQLLMAIPITILYSIGAGLTYLMEVQREKGLKPSRGLDWQLLGAVLVLSSLLVLLIYPRWRADAAFLPYGARSVAMAAGKGPATLLCGLIPPDEARTLREEGELTCARYQEGNIIIFRNREESEIEPDCHGRKWQSGQETDCQVVGGVMVAGQPLLVSRYVQNRTNRHVEPDPLAMEEDTGFTIFVSLMATEKQQQSFLRVTLVEDGSEVRLDLAFKDPDEARNFLEAVESQDVSNLVETVAEQTVEDDKVRLALGALAEAVDQLADRAGDEAVEARKKVKLARSLLDIDVPGQELGATASPLLACTSPYCAYSKLYLLLPQPESTRLRGRMVTTIYKPDSPPEEEGELMKLLAAAANGQ